MSHVQNTQYSGNPHASTYHRILGKNIYATDIDQIECTNGTIQEMYIEYKFDQNRPKSVAWIDFKNPGLKLSDKFTTCMIQSDDATRLNIPFFYVITYLDDRYPVKMYYVIPINTIARDLFGNKEIGYWLSLKDFSKFQHSLRGIKWNGNETIDNQNLSKCHLPHNLKLNQLSSEVVKYQLPALDFSWQK